MTSDGTLSLSKFLKSKMFFYNYLYSKENVSNLSLLFIFIEQALLIPLFTNEYC